MKSSGEEKEMKEIVKKTFSLGLSLFPWSDVLKSVLLTSQVCQFFVSRGHQLVSLSGNCPAQCGYVNEREKKNKIWLSTLIKFYKFSNRIESNVGIEVEPHICFISLRQVFNGAEISGKKTSSRALEWIAQKAKNKNVKRVFV